MAVNIHPEEDEFVLPFMKSNRYGFVPLKGNSKWATDNYNVRGTPSNFLFDAEGRIIFQPRVHSKDAARKFGLMIESLLSHSAGAKSID